MSDKERPADSVVDGKGRTRGGFSEVAHLLNERFPRRRRPISRQLVHKWWLFRHDNRFPEAADTEGTSRGGRGSAKFHYAAVVEWYELHRQPRDERRYTTQGAPPATTRSATTESDRGMRAA